VSRPRAIAAAALVAIGTACIGQAAWIHVKAVVAQRLLERAWTKTLASGQPVQPWPWADHEPVGRLRVPAQGVDLLVLAGATGRTLAFAPGELAGSVAPGKPGTLVIAGHRDTHFRFLREIEIGQRVELVDRDGSEYGYRVIAREIVHDREGWAPEPWGPARLELVTCYPFDQPVPGGPLRWVVTAELESTRASELLDPVARELFAGQPVLADLDLDRDRDLGRARF